MTPKHPFTDVKTVTGPDNAWLLKKGFVNDCGTVVGWTSLAPHLSSRRLSERDAKLLVLRELEAFIPRRGLITRLVSYLSYSEKEQTMETINTLLNK
jgi:hypothetical protein